MKILMGIFWACVCLLLLPFLVLYFLSGLLVIVPVWVIERFILKD